MSKLRIKGLPYYVMAVMVSLLFFLNTWQSYRYEQLRRQVEQMEVDQKDWLEKNKRLVAGISLLESPRRIGRLAEEELSLSMITPDRLEQIFFVVPQEASHE